MKTEISFKIGDLAEIVANAAEAKEVLVGLVAYDLLSDDPDGMGQRSVEEAKDLYRDILNHTPSRDFLNEMHQQLAFGHLCAVALWQLNAYNAITSEYELPEIDTDNREQTRITLAKSSLIQRATNSTFRDYND